MLQSTCNKFGLQVAGTIGSGHSRGAMNSQDFGMGTKINIEVQ